MEIENNYYYDDIEKEILASGIKTQFGLFYNNFYKTTNPNKMKAISDANIKLLEQFFSFMFLRAKKSLETINNESITSVII